MINYDQHTDIANSSVIESVDYSTASKAMRVQFLNGSAKEYSGITSAQYEALIAAPSAGKYLNQHIKQTGIALPAKRKQPTNPWMK